MLLSQGEIESIAYKAARGAGYDWGMAEEAAFATAWLARNGVASGGVLLDVLRQKEAMLLSSKIRIEARHWGPELGSVFCPIHLGASLSDHANLPDGPLFGQITFAPIAAPVLLVPFLAQISQSVRCCLRLSWGDGHALLNNGSLMEMTAPIDTRPIAAMSSVFAAPIAAQHSTEPVPDFDWPQPVTNGLSVYVHRTYVPASDASRHGAGSTISDNS